MLLPRVGRSDSSAAVGSTSVLVSFFRLKLAFRAGVGGAHRWTRTAPKWPNCGDALNA
jgi:hypothetical protein